MHVNQGAWRGEMTFTSQLRFHLAPSEFPDQLFLAFLWIDSLATFPGSPANASGS